ncbi:SHOCT domain-containing protein [Fulvimonas sp. R45]|uniref:SHOCT domain-containing protein n=1 Tax=Fulvimonas sp. R45 TaxID=3045937 RepID=UPI00265E553F|nr:SHOCT domain-containing protein [Fulvimonas sp. R45]MDO1528991.1 SHOCT domain-containing protein [Fulvimonas sp. R45]
MDGLFHWLILAVPVAIIALVVRLVRRASRGASSEARLRELAALKARGLVTESEYERQRRAIIGDV